MRKKKKLQKYPSNYYLWKVKKFHGDSVTNESARATNLEGKGETKFENYKFTEGKIEWDIGLKDTIVNRACHLINWWYFKITPITRSPMKYLLIWKKLFPN